MNATGGDEGGGGCGEGAGADATGLTQLKGRKRAIGLGEGQEDSFCWGRRRRLFIARRSIEHSECRGVAVERQVEGDVVRRRGRPLLDGEDQMAIVAAQVEIGVAPAMKIGRTPERLTRLIRCGPLADMMDQQNRRAELALEFAQIPQQRGDVLGGVFVHPMQADEGIEDQERRAQLGHGGAQPLPVLRDVEQDPRGGDHVDGQLIELCASGQADAFQPLADNRQRVFGREDQHRPGAADREPAQAGSAGGDADGDIQRQEALAALGLAAEYADRLVGPESFDQPLRLVAVIGQFAGAFYRQAVHGLARDNGFGSIANTSKKSFSSIWSSSLRRAAASRSLAMFIIAR